jgi:hypothetical protein
MVIHENTDSIRQRVLYIWIENPTLKAREICTNLDLLYKEHGRYGNTLLSVFRSNYNYGLPPEPQKLHKRIFSWENVPRHTLLKHLNCREEDLTKGELRKLGWLKSRNKNGMLIYRNKHGKIHWYKGGRILLYLGKPAMVAKAKELFCRAFSLFDPKELSKYVDVPLHEESRHWVFDVGKPVPRFEIQKFKRSHGMRIYSDKSHPYAVEVEETVPFWIKDLQATAQSFGRTVNQFGVEIKEHMKLIREWREEAKARRQISLSSFLWKQFRKISNLITGFISRLLHAPRNT